MATTTTLSLDVIQIQNPCTVSWEHMQGDEQVRFCGECKLNVFNLSALTRGAAEALIAKREGRLCVKYFQRSDGTVITQDCGRILRAMRRTRRMITAAITTIFVAVLAPFGIAWSVHQVESPFENPTPANEDVQGKIAIPKVVAIPNVPLDPQQLMGVLAPIEPKAPPAPQPKPPVKIKKLPTPSRIKR